MILFKKYTNLPNFMDRFTIMKLGRLHIRKHVIMSEDKSSFLHNHPFSYISIILKGGYTEQLLIGEELKETYHGPGSVLFRSHKQFHRIKSINGRVTTIIFTWVKNKPWELIPHDSIEYQGEKREDGIYTRTIKGEEKYYKSKNNMWYVGNKDKSIAENETRLSIHQHGK